MKKFNDIKIGDKSELNHIITQCDIDSFVKLTGDDNKLHVDNEYAHRTPFKKTIAHGMLGAAFISTVIGTKLPGDGAVWLSQNMDFLIPVYVGDKIRVVVTVEKKFDALKEIELKTDIFNQDEQLVTTGKGKVKIFEQKKEDVFRSTIQSHRFALIVGATGGIGEAACLQLADDGFDVAIHYNKNKDRAERILKEVSKSGQKSLVVQADLSRPDQIKEMIYLVERKLQTITVVVNCATIPITNTKLENMDWKTIQKFLDVNVKGVFYVQKYVIPIMEKNKYGKIINITTESTKNPCAEWLHYITSKSALEGFSYASSVELASRGIRVNMVSPGMTNTSLISNIPERIKLLHEAGVPLGRMANPFDVAGAISYLASHKSDFLTGETIRVSGGKVML